MRLSKYRPCFQGVGSILQAPEIKSRGIATKALRGDQSAFWRQNLNGLFYLLDTPLLYRHKQR